MSQNSKSKRLWECSEPMTHGILTELKNLFWQLLSQYCGCFQYVPNWYLRNLCHDFFKVASIKPEVSEFFRCLLISLRLSDSDKNFLTFRITVVLLFFFFGFCLCSSLTMCLFRLKAELNVLEHSLHRCLSATLTFFCRNLVSSFVIAIQSHLRRIHHKNMTFCHESWSDGWGEELPQ